MRFWVAARACSAIHRPPALGPATAPRSLADALREGQATQHSAGDFFSQRGAEAFGPDHGVLSNVFVAVTLKTGQPAVRPPRQASPLRPEGNLLGLQMMR